MKQKDMTVFSLVLALCVIGVVAGMVIAKRYDTHTQEVAAVISSTKLSQQNLHNVFVKGLMYNLPWLAAFWILSFWNWGVFISIVLLFYKSYALGLCAMNISMAMGVRGVVMAVFSVILPGVLLLMLYSYIIADTIGDESRSTKIKSVKEKGAFFKTFMNILCFLVSVYGQSLIQYVAFYKF